MKFEIGDLGDLALSIGFIALFTFIGERIWRYNLI